jgi:hypothetical protein
MTKTIETPTSEEAPTTAPKRRRAMPILIAVIAALATALLVMTGILTYRDQADTVQYMESSARPSDNSLGEKFDADPDVQAFQQSPVFKSQPWTDLLAESRKGYEELKTHDERSMLRLAENVWWPTLTDRAQAAVRAPQLDPAAWDHMEFVLAAGPVMFSCNDKALTTEQRVADWMAKRADSKGDYYDAQRKVMPAVFEAGVPIFCK